MAEVEPHQPTYREALLNAYTKRIEGLDPDQAVKQSWFDEYVSENYATTLEPISRSEAILDIGCSRGYLLRTLQSRGWTRLTGVDASPGDIDIAQRYVSDVEFVVADAQRFLESRPGSYRVAIMRATLEHIPKPDVVPVLHALRSALGPGGIAIIDVPNMDWLFATHERYMDFTHEVGFTSDSLVQVLSLMFDSVELRPVEHLTRIDRNAWRTRLGRAMLRRLLRWADPQGAQNHIFARNLIAIARADG